MNSRNKIKNRRKSSDILVILSPSSEDPNTRKPFTMRHHSPIPSRDEIDKRFSQVMSSIDLKDDKRELLEGYSDEKKWQIVCDTTMVSAKEQPSYYISAINNHMYDTNGKGKLSKTQDSWDIIMSDLEISLRTNSIKWVKEFLSNENNGLNAVVGLLSQAVQAIMSGSDTNQKQTNQTVSGSKPTSILFGKSSQEKAKVQTLKTAHFDVHVCVKCLKAIMNHKHGFNLIFVHESAINCTVQSLIINNNKTRTLVLDVISVLCLVKGGHAKVLRAFENLKKICGETRRFERLMQWFRCEDGFDLDLSVACMRCINLIVHSPEDMNYRVYLQHEFKLLLLEDYLAILSAMGGESLTNQVNAYLSNCFDVASLMSDAKYVNEVKDKTDEIIKLKKKFEEIENSALEKIAHLENQLLQTNDDKKEMKNKLEYLQQELRDSHQKYSEDKSREDQPKSPTNHETPKGSPAPADLESPTPEPPSFDSVNGPPSPALPPPLPPPPPPPPAPPLTGLSNGKLCSSGDISSKDQKSDSIKSVVKSRQRLTALNWTPINQSQIKGTIYEHIDEESIYKILNLEELEERFKLHSKRGFDLTMQDHHDNKNHTSHGINYRSVKKVDAMSMNIILAPKRRQNVAIARKKLNLGVQELSTALEHFDLRTLTPDKVDLVERMSPNDEEEQAFLSFKSSGKKMEDLTEDDRFMVALMSTPRLSQKLQVLSLISNFESTIGSLLPQIQAIKSASISLKNSKLFKKLLQIVLAVGNYMNSQNRGGAYGFKLQNLELLSDTKTSDRKQTLLHFIVKICIEKFPDVLNFYKEFNFMERAASASVEIIVSDLSTIRKQLTTGESEIMENTKLSSRFNSFMVGVRERLEKIEKDQTSAMESFSQVSSYFGENSRTSTPNVFFGIIIKFVNNFKQVEQSLSKDESSRRNYHQSNQSNVFKQPEILDELKKKVKEKKVLNQDEVGFGTVDGILEDLKNEPFVRHDAYYKSRRKQPRDVK